jgi:hypothetical protein
LIYNALSNASLGLQLTKKVGTRTRITTPATFLSDLDFADFSDCVVKAQTMLSAIENTALKVGLKINLKKTEYLLVGAWVDPVMVSLSSGPLARVDDFKYLGSWLMNSMKDFEVRKALAWKAATRLVKVWKRKNMSRSLKLKLFLACV